MTTPAVLEPAGPIAREEEPDPRIPRVAQAFRQVMEALELDLGDPNLADTPQRVARAYTELFAGLRQGAEPELRTFPNEEHYSQMVAVTGIPFYSLCAHHFLPFFGRAHVAYIPNGKIIGLSKIPRIIDVFARRLQVQERLTTQVAEELKRVLKPHGVAVIIEAFHLCMMMRGVEKQNSKTVTSALRGSFRDDAKSRDEFLRLAHGGHWIE